ncbi:MAG TPA: hypothetical protein VGB17_09120 [Pyrinomonadaceae bacterium]|jgi:hypothetical protein
MLSRKRSLACLTLLLLAIAGFLYASREATAQQKKKEKVIESTGQSPTLQLTASENQISGCSGEAAQVQLNARAVSPAGNPIHYKWSSSGGRIVGGDISNPTWDLTGARPGAYRAIVEIDSGTGAPGDNCVAFSSVAVYVRECPPPTCPNITIYCPGNVAPGQPITFTASVAGGPSSIAPIYNWKVSGGTIISGQGTTSIQVDTAGLAGQSITATLDVGGYNLACNATCTAQVPTLPLLPRRFDTFPQIRFNDEKARLDNLAIQLQTEPDAKGYIIVYSGRRDRPGAAVARANRAKDYLVNTRHIDAARIITLTAGPRDIQEVELWIVPQGASAPTP